LADNGKPRTLARRLTSFDALLIVLGGIVGSGIFQNPSVVAQRIHTPVLIMGAWAFGGLIALIGGFIFAELAWRRPDVGGLYVYMRDAFHPVVAFCYGWTALLVSQSGGMALAAITFAYYIAPFTIFSSSTIAILILLLFSAINCFGVREGGLTQNIIMLLKLASVAILIGIGIFAAPHAQHVSASQPAVSPSQLLMALGLAMIPVFYAYDGWQTASLMSGECTDPARSLPRGLVYGVLTVIVLYLLVNWTALRVLGPGGLAATNTPASDILRLAMGPFGARLIAVFVALSTLGFLSNQILTSPRIYYAMANDGLFFRQVAWLHPKSRVPIVSIALQAVIAVVILVIWGESYGNILNYVTSMDFIFFALAAGALFVFRKPADPSNAATGIRVPWHPWSTLFFLIVCSAIVLNSLIAVPKDTVIGVVLLLSGVPIYYLWRRKK
jgi:APA family basic amino acid/polyamine antiporter